MPATTPGQRALGLIRTEINRHIGKPGVGNLNGKVNAWLDTLEAELKGYTRLADQRRTLEDMARAMNNQSQVVVSVIRDMGRQLPAATDDENGDDGTSETKGA